MGTLYRSQEMQLVQLFVQIEAARDTIDELGKLGLIQFRDLNPEVSSFQRNFVNEVKRCDEMLRKLRFFSEMLTKEASEVDTEKKKGREEMEILQLREGIGFINPPDLGTKRIEELELQFDDLEKQLIAQNQNREQLTRNYNLSIELKHVLQKDSSFFAEASDFERTEDDEENRGLLQQPSDPNRTVKLGFLTGVISRDKFLSFERVLWRVLRGNLFMKHAEIEEKVRDPVSGELSEKNVFIIFYQGERAQMKIKKICESYGAKLYPCPETSVKRAELLDQVNQRLTDLDTVLSKTRKERRSLLLDIGRQLKAWIERVTKESAIFHTMNLFNYDVGRKCLIAEGWCPKNATDRIINAMRQATENSGALVPSILSVIEAHEEPPTYFQTNKFTASFQAIVDAYGVAHYREVNPTIFTIITFPFLFAVMFGDTGHGLILAIFALYLILREEQLEKAKLNEMIVTIFQGRYMLLLMGIFSIYTGLIYNEAFAISIDIFGSSWEYPNVNATEAVLVTDRVYPFGVDPIWKTATNTLLYYNSLKMKMSIIMGVTQMVLGIIMSLLNAIYFKRMINILGEFIPQMIFMLSLFGYMSFLIIYKWCTNWQYINNNAPMLLNVMIGMFLEPYHLPPEYTVYSGQLYIQWLLLFLAFISIPWMLLSKPLWLRYKHKQRLRHTSPELLEEEEVDDGHGGGGPFDFGEIFIKQTIHTIEFALGAISNTASYLRLWALSLAHAQLSEVFYSRVFLFTVSYGNFFMIFVGFAIWAAATFAVLLIMESLSAFLHALRLHWVEFQNKFYLGDGRLFTPFSYTRILANVSVAGTASKVEED